jgi:TonB family protein
MYFDFEDFHPDITPVGRAISWREGVLLSIIVHLVGVIAILTAPRWMPASWLEKPTPTPLLVQNEDKEPMRFVMVQPKVDLKALKPPPTAPPSDLDREARTRERAPKPANEMPKLEGNTRQQLEQAERQVAKGPEQPQPAAPSAPEPPAPPAADPAVRLPEAPAVQFPTPTPQPPSQNPNANRAPSGGALGDSLRNLQRYVQRDQFENSQGGNGAFGPAIQFDTKGVEFGPWIRRFIAQVRRNWEPLIPLAAMTSHGHVVVTFNVHKDGRISDLNVVGASTVQAFNTAAYGALASSNPTVPLPPEYPTDPAFFTVTFFYNEDPQ